MSKLLDSIEAKRAILVKAKEGAERTRKDARKVREHFEIIDAMLGGYCVGSKRR